MKKNNQQENRRNGNKKNEDKVEIRKFIEDKEEMIQMKMEGMQDGKEKKIEKNLVVLVK